MGNILPPGELLLLGAVSKLPYPGGVSCGSKNIDSVTGTEAIMIESVNIRLILRRFFLVIVFLFVGTNIHCNCRSLKFNALLNFRFAGH